MLVVVVKRQLQHESVGWVRFRECGELLLGNRFPLKMKGKVYRCCVRSAILYGRVNPATSVKGTTPDKN